MDQITQEQENELRALDGIAQEVGPELSGEMAGPDPQPEVPTGEILLQLYLPIAEIFAPAWQLKTEELKAVADAHGAVFDKYMPGGFSMGVELNAALVTMAVFAPRWAMPRTYPEPEKKEGQTAGQSSDGEKKPVEVINANE